MAKDHPPCASLAPDQMKTLLDKFRGGLDGFRARSRQKAFLEVVMAGTALVALADRDERLSELVARDRVLSRLGDLLPVDARDAVAVYERYARRLDEHPERGRQEVLAKIGAFEGSREDTLSLIRACLAIGHADSDFSARERSVVEEICRQVGVDPGELGVYDI